MFEDTFEALVDCSQTTQVEVACLTGENPRELLWRYCEENSVGTSEIWISY